MNIENTTYNNFIQIGFLGVLFLLDSVTKVSLTTGLNAVSLFGYHFYWLVLTHINTGTDQEPSKYISRIPIQKRVGIKVKLFPKLLRVIQKVILPQSTNIIGKNSSFSTKTLFLI